MKTTFVIAMCLMIASLAHAQTASLTVEVHHFKNTNGRLKVALFNSEQTYLGDSQYSGDTIIYDLDRVQLVFEELPFGEYAISVYHDENENGVLDANFMGIPTEAYAFSNNAPSRFGPAKYENAKFMVESKSQTHSIQLHD